MTLKAILAFAFSALMGAALYALAIRRTRDGIVMFVVALFCYVLGRIMR
jgi:hypothetical protein